MKVTIADQLKTKGIEIEAINKSDFKIYKRREFGELMSKLKRATAQGESLSPELIEFQSYVDELDRRREIEEDLVTGMDEVDALFFSVIMTTNKLSKLEKRILRLSMFKDMDFMEVAYLLFTTLDRVERIFEEAREKVLKLMGE